jgi:hypothetical protein
MDTLKDASGICEVQTALQQRFVALAAVKLDFYLLYPQ